MTEPTSDDGLVESTVRLVKAVESFQASRAPSAVGSSHVTINAGGLGVAVALIACALMLGVNLAMVATFVTQDRKIDRMQDHLNAIYMLAPQLRPPQAQPQESDN
jgi:hypothetical protein